MSGARAEATSPLAPDATVAARQALHLPARRRHHHADHHGHAGVLGRRPGGRVHRHNPLATYRAIFDGTGLNWFFPWISEGPDDRRAQPAADADHDDAADPDRPGGRVRVPLRPVQHRRPGSVPGRLDRRGLDRLLVRRTCRPSCTSCSRSSAAWRAVRCGAVSPAPEGDHGRQRGHLHDHAQLDRGLGRPLAIQARRAAAEPPTSKLRSRTTSSRAPSCRCSGAT